MTLLAIVLKRRYFDQGVSPRLAYATLGLLFVNVSIGGTLTHFAAPPVLMVAKNGSGTRRSCSSTSVGERDQFGVSTALVAWCFGRSYWR